VYDSLSRPNPLGFATPKWSPEIQRKYPGSPGSKRKYQATKQLVIKGALSASDSFLSYFAHVQNYLEIEGNLKIQKITRITKELEKVRFNFERCASRDQVLLPMGN